MNKLILFLCAFTLLLALFTPLSIAKEEENIHCNCVQCDYKLHVKGSQSWCRCCEQSMIPQCRNPLTTDPRCQKSIFDSQGCIRDGYLTKYCKEDVVFGPPTTTTPAPTTPAPTTPAPITPAPTTPTTTTPAPTTPAPTTPAPTTPAPTTPAPTTPAPTTPAPTTPAPTTPVLPPQVTKPKPTKPPTIPPTTRPKQCNCVLCDSEHLIPGSWNWCRCCRVQYELPRRECLWNYRCLRSVFDLDGCIAQDWENKCAWTEKELGPNPDPNLRPVVVDDPPPNNLVDHPEVTAHDLSDHNSNPKVETSESTTSKLSSTALGLIIAAAVLVFLGCAGSIGYFLFNKNRDSQSMV